MIHGVEQAAAQTHGGAKTDGGDDVADLRNGVERQKALEVMLCQRHGHAHEHGHAAQQHQQALHRGNIHGPEDHIGQTDHGIDTGLVDHTGEQHGHGGGRRRIGIGRGGMEGHNVALDAETGKEQAEGQHGGGGQALITGQDGGDLCHVQRMALGVDQNHARQHEGRTGRAHHQILEGGLQRAGGPVAERGQRHGGEGHDLDHDKHIEQIAREHQTQYGAGEHQVQGIVAVQIVVPLHIAQGIPAGKQRGEGHQQRKEQVQRIDLVADTDGVALHRLPVAHPVGDDLAVEHDGLNEVENQAEGDDRSGHGNDPAQILAARTEDDHQEGRQKQGHDRDDGKMYVTHPFSLLTSVESMV